MTIKGTQITRIYNKCYGYTKGHSVFVQRYEELILKHLLPSHSHKHVGHNCEEYG